MISALVWFLNNKAYDIDCKYFVGKPAELTLTVEWGCLYNSASLALCRNQLQKCRGCSCLIVAEECTSTNQGTFWNLRRFTIIIPLAVTWKQLLAVWGNCSKENLKRLLRIQKRCAQLVLNAKFSYNSVKLFTTLGWLPIDDIICSRKLDLLHKISFADCPDYFIPYIHTLSKGHS